MIWYRDVILIYYFVFYFIILKRVDDNCIDLLFVLNIILMISFILRILIIVFVC